MAEHAEQARNYAERTAAVATLSPPEDCFAANGMEKSDIEVKRVVTATSLLSGLVGLVLTEKSYHAVSSPLHCTL